MNQDISQTAREALGELARLARQVEDDGTVQFHWQAVEEAIALLDRFVSNVPIRKSV
jgi:hypothetical protein